MMMMMMMKVMMIDEGDDDDDRSQYMGMLKAEALTASKPELRPALRSIARYMRRGSILYTMD